MKNKKVASLGLALTMVANAVPALATETQTPHDIETHKTDDVMGTDAHVCDTQEIAKDESASCNVYAEVGSEFTVTIPKSLTLSGADKTGAYDVAVEGDIAGDQFISVVPDAQFAMVQTGKADVTASITQEITKFRGDNYTGTLGTGEALFATGAEGAIDAQDLTAGAWNGTFNFNIKLEGGTGAGTEEDEPVALEAGLYDADGVMLASWDEAGIDVTTDYTYSNHKTSTASGYTVLNKPEYTSTTKIVLPENLTTISNYALIKCPICGKGLYGNKSIKNRNGKHYKDYYFYGCKHRQAVDGHKCTFSKQIAEDKFDSAVAEIVIKLVQNPKFANLIKEKINTTIDISTITAEYENLIQQYKKVVALKDRLNEMKLKIDPFDKHYELKVADIDKQVEAQYDKMVDLQEAIEECGSRKKNIEEAHLSSQRIYKILVYFDKLYDTMDDKDKQLFFKSLIKEIQIYEEPVGKQWIKSIKFTFPILDGVDEIGLDKEGTVECVVLLTR